MNDELYLVDVSSLKIYTKPNKPSKISISRNTLVKTTGASKKYHFEEWVPIITNTSPVIAGYVLKKFLKKV